MTTATSKSYCLLLIGRTGNGKSSTGNTILGDEYFATSNTGRSSKPEAKLAIFKNVNLKVVDGQGFESKLPNESNRYKRIITEINSALLLCGDGFDALILVLKYGNRFTQEEQDVIKILKQVLGPNIIKNHVIIVYTNGEDFGLYAQLKEDLKFENWCHNQTGELSKLIKECDNRVVLFHNFTEEMRKESVEKLLSLVEKIEKRYTGAMFEGLKEDHAKLVCRESANQAEQRLQQKIDCINCKLDSAKKSTRFEEVRQCQKFPEDLKKELEILQEETKSLMGEIEIEDQGTEALGFLKRSVDYVLVDINSLLNSYHRQESEQAVDLRRNDENENILSRLLYYVPAKIEQLLIYCNLISQRSRTTLK